MAPTTAQLVIGVDTHADRHVAVAGHPWPSSGHGQLRGQRHGNARLLAWACQHGRPVAAGVEGTGSFGYRLARYLLAHGVAVREVNRPDRARAASGRQERPPGCRACRLGRAGRPGQRHPKNRDGVVGELRCLVVARRSAVKARTQATNQLRPCWSAATTPSAPGWGGCASSTWPAPASGSAPPAPPNSPCAPSAPLARLGHRDRRARPGDQPAGHPGSRPDSWNATASVSTPPPSCSSPPATTRIGWPTRPPSLPWWTSPASAGPPLRLNRGGDRQANTAL